MKTKTMARDAARIVHGVAVDVRCRRVHFAALRATYAAEVIRRGRGRGPNARTSVLEDTGGHPSPAAAYDALCLKLWSRAYVQRAEVVSDHGAIGAVAVSVGRSIGRDELAPGTTVLRAFALEAEGDPAAVGAALDIVGRLIGGAK